MSGVLDENEIFSILTCDEPVSEADRLNVSLDEDVQGGPSTSHVNNLAEEDDDLSDARSEVSDHDTASEISFSGGADNDDDSSGEEVEEEAGKLSLGYM